MGMCMGRMGTIITDEKVTRYSLFVSRRSVFTDFTSNE